MTTEPNTPTEWKRVMDSLGRQHRANENAILVLIKTHPGLDAVELREQFGMPRTCASTLIHMEDSQKAITFRTVAGKPGWFLTGKGDALLMEIMPAPEATDA